MNDGMNYGTKEVAATEVDLNDENLANVIGQSNYNTLKDDVELLDGASEEFDSELVGAVVNLAKCRGLTVCVKGVEDKEQLNAAQQYAIDRMQGYYCSRPLSEEEARAAFAERISVNNNRL